MSEGLSLREFARQINVTAEGVRKAILSGKIPADCVGQRPGNAGKMWPVIINPERAAAQWGRNRDPNQVRDRATMSAGAKAGWEKRRGREPDEPEDGDQAGRAPPPLRAGSAPSITESKQITEAYKARLAKLEYEERSGKLVNADKIKVGMVNMITAAKTRVLGVPSKAKARIPTLTIADIEILEELLAEALEELSVGS